MQCSPHWGEAAQTTVSNNFTWGENNSSLRSPKMNRKRWDWNLAKIEDYCTIWKAALLLLFCLFLAPPGMGRYAKSYMAVRCFLPAQHTECRGDTILTLVFFRDEAVRNNNVIFGKSPMNYFDRQKKKYYLLGRKPGVMGSVLYNMLLHGSSHNWGKKQDRIISFFRVLLKANFGRFMFLTAGAVALAGSFRWNVLLLA